MRFQILNHNGDRNDPMPDRNRIQLQAMPRIQGVPVERRHRRLRQAGRRTARKKSLGQE